MAGTLGATRFYACARHGARARHTRTHAAGRGRRLGIRSHRLPLRLLGFLPGRGSRAGAGRGGGSLGRGSAGSVAGARTGLGWWWLGGVPAAGSCVSELSPAALGPPRPVPAPAGRARPFFPGRPGARRRSRGGGDRRPAGSQPWRRPPGHPLKDAIVAAERIGPRGALFIYLFFPSPFSRAEPFCERRLVPRAGPRATRADPDSSPPPTRAPLKPFPIPSHFPSPLPGCKCFIYFLKSAGSSSSPPPSRLES